MIPRTCVYSLQFQHTAARRRLPFSLLCNRFGKLCFNTQPPEGGCGTEVKKDKPITRFNTQPPEGGCKLQLY